MSGKSLNHRYIPGLDGIRALAVLAVIAYHFNFSWARGGFLVWAMLFHKKLLHTLRGDALSSIFYSSNWWFIFHKLSYFDSFGSPSPLKNLWSLAIEEQFYVIWPVLLMIGLYVVKKQSKLAKIVFFGAICSALLMAILYQPGADPSRVYYGTDTRCFELLIGCWLALIWPMKRLSSQKLSTSHMKKLNAISFISFTIFLVSIMYVDEFQTFLYRGGMFLFCLNAAVLIACVCHPVSILGRILAWKPLCWIGSRSYGIYLWHYPVMVLGTPIHEIGNPSYWRIALQLVLIVTIAECSYRFIEMPIRKEGFWAYYRTYFVFNKKKWGSLTFSRKVSTVMVPLFLLVFFTGITGVVGEGQQSSKDSYPTAIKINGDEPTANPDKTNDNPSPSKEEEVTDVPDIETPKPEENETNVVPEKEDTYQNILAIGDSVMIDIATSLHKVFPNITIDGKIGRQVSQAVKLAPNYASFNQSNNAIIIQLGTNGYFTND